MDNKTYQNKELSGFDNSNHAYFDNVADFAESLDRMDIPEQIEWMENGSYGAGACFALQRALNQLSNRTNNVARIGQVALHALYGKRFMQWNKLPVSVQDKMSAAVGEWLGKDHSFAQKLES